VATPPATVTTPGLLEFQLELLVTSITPLHVVALAVNVLVFGVPVTKMFALVGDMAIDWIHPTVTVIACVPEIVGLVVDVAVTVAEPVATDVTKPPGVIFAIVLSEGVILQVTGVLPVLLSLNVPVADICTVLFVLPV
jgi:hypothetical protein